MNTPLAYGLGITFASAVLTLVLHLLGLTTNPEKMLITGLIILPCVIAIVTTGLVLGMRKERARIGGGGFSYGQALKTGFLISLCAAVAGAAFNFIYYKFLFTDFAEVSIEGTRMFMERMGAPASAIEKALDDMRTKTTVTRQVVIGGIFTVVLGSIISLIAAAIIKRPPPEDLPPPLG
jgi:hypothetical protein